LTDIDLCSPDSRHPKAILHSISFPQKKALTILKWGLLINKEINPEGVDVELIDKRELLEKSR
jgi:hypothetical protein